MDFLDLLASKSKVKSLKFHRITFAGATGLKSTQRKIVTYRTKSGDANDAHFQI